jgi:LPXTG-site transpeptidase (sortase) family protein
MKSSWWMVLFGYMLLMAGLANSIYGFRQTPSAFDIAEEASPEVSSNTAMVPAFQGTTQQPVQQTTVSEQVPVNSSQPARVYEEPDRPVGLIPDRLVIPSIGLDAPIVPTKVKKIDYQGQTYYQWLAPNEPAVGWHDSSALLGLPGNTVLNGHHNVYGEVFKDLVNVHEGDLIEVYSGEQVYKYHVVLAMLVPERFKSLTIRLDNARWILPTDDERLTLITCWPATSNTHRVIIVALPE